MTQEISAEKSEAYKTALNESYDKTTELLERIVELKKKQNLKNPTEPSLQELKELEALRKNMVLDTISLTTTRHEWKNEINSLDDKFKSKVNSFNSVKKFNKKQYIIYQTELMRSENLFKELNRLLKEIPDFKFLNSITTTTQEQQQADTPNNNDEVMFSKLSKSREDIKKSIINSDNDSDSKIGFQFTEEDIENLKSKLKNNDMNKFKLIQNVKYYETKVNNLQVMKSKWERNLNDLKKFVKQDVTSVKDNLLIVQNTLQNEKQEESSSSESESESDSNIDIEDEGYEEDAVESAEPERVERVEDEGEESDLVVQEITVEEPAKQDVEDAVKEHHDENQLLERDTDDLDEFADAEYNSDHSMEIEE